MNTLFRLAAITATISLLTTINATSQSDTTYLINKLWEKRTSTPDSIRWSATVQDQWLNIITTSNVVQNGYADIHVISISEGGDTNWIATYDGAQGRSDYGAAIAVDGSGNVYVVGAAQETDTSAFDIVLIKYTSQGAEDWVETWNHDDTLNDIPVAVERDPSGNIYVVGSSQDPTTDYDYITLKYNSAGDLQWAERYDGNGLNDIAADVSVGHGGDVTTFGGSMDSIGMSGINYWSYTTVNYSTSGILQNDNREEAEGGEIDDPRDLVTDGQRNYYIAGGYWNGTDHDMKVIKLDSALNTEWTRTIGDPNSEEIANAVAVDENGNVYAGGWQQQITGERNWYLTKLDPSGNILSAPMPFAPDYSKPDGAINRIVLDENSDLIVLGTASNGFERDIVMLNMDAQLNPNWQKQWSGMGQTIDYPTGVVTVSLTDDVQDVYLSGMSYNGAVTEFVTVKYSVWERSRSYVTDESGTPLHVDNEIIVRFNPAFIDTNFTNNKGLMWGVVGDFLDSEAIEAINIALEWNIEQMKCHKVHPSLTSRDTTSVSRFGNIVNLPPLYATFVVRLPNSSDDSLVVDLLNATVPYVIVATINGCAYLTIGANDPFYNNGESAGLHPSTAIPDANINIEPAWDHETGSSSVIVGVYDSGINNKHQDLSAGSFATSSVKDGYDYFNNLPITASSNPDNYGHGSVVTGVIAAWRNNNFGIAGVAGGPSGLGGVSIHDMKMFQGNQNCGPAAAATFDVIQRAIHEGSLDSAMPRQHIQNHSWYHGGNANPLVREAFRTAYENGVVLCVASGNFENDPDCVGINYPATFRDHMVMKIGANDATGARASSFSGCGAGLDFIAPGTRDLYIGLGRDAANFTDQQLWGNQCKKYIDGTSFASPHVAGVAALMLGYAANNGLPNSFSHEDCEELLQRTATDIVDSPADTGYDDQTGWGRIDAGALFEHIRYPAYRVQHYEFQVNANTATRVSGFFPNYYELSCLEQSKFGLPIGLNFVRRWEITGTNSHTLPTGYSLIAGWPRGSASNTIGITSTDVTQPNCGSSIDDYYLPAETDAILESFSATAATMTGYIYEYLQYDDPNMISLGWFPFDTSGVATLAYTLYLVDSTRLDVVKPYAANLTVYPNPANQSVTVKFGNANGAGSLILLDAHGKIVMVTSDDRHYSNQQEVTFSIAGLPSGLYLIRCTNAAIRETAKLIVAH